MYFFRIISKASAPEKVRHLSMLKSMAVDWGLDFDLAVQAQQAALIKLLVWAATQFD
jgi:hypothetical protein